MTAEEPNDVAMADSADAADLKVDEQTAPMAMDEAATDANANADAGVGEDKPAEPSVEERVQQAEAAKEAGNLLLKAGDPTGAVAKYLEGIGLTEPVLEKSPEEAGGEELQRRGVAAHLALRLNSAQACLKLSDWVMAIEHCDKALLIDKDNTKALYRRASAGVQLDTEGRLDDARNDLSRLVQLEPSNREARELLGRARERLREVRQQEKERMASVIKGGGLYQEQHNKLARKRALYDEEVARRKEAGEDEISFEEWEKKRKEKEDEAKTKEKEAAEEKRRQEREAQERSAWEEDMAKRKEEGLEELSLEAWREARKNAPRKEEIVRTDELELDDEEKRLLAEAKNKGYYHGRLGTVLSAAAPTPQQVEAQATESDELKPPSRNVSEWNQGGTWEERNTTDWAKERLTAWLNNASVACDRATLESGEALSVSVKVSKVKSLKGDAQIIVVRKQPRHGFHFEAELSVKLSFKPVDAADEGKEAETFSGSIIMPELADSVDVQSLRLDCAWGSRRPPERLQPLAQEWFRKLQDSVRQQVAGFIEEYKDK